MERAYLYWDHQAQAMLVKSNRWANGTERVFANQPNPALSSSLLTVVLGLAVQDGDNRLARRRVVAEFVEDGRLGPSAVANAIRSLLTSPTVSPAPIAGVLAKAPHLLGVLWPILTEAVRFAGAIAGPLPNWVNLVLDAARRLAPYLREAASRGLLGESATWPGLAELAGRASASAAVTKAQGLRKALGLIDA